ncbi:MAG: UDP-2,3-diacylglucosamine diphosphatase [Ignavibacteria bacterium]|nr:UDP-2,3-diacylglucosamine diphosphatase [Ignavibacteria bacterium]
MDENIQIETVDTIILSDIHLGSEVSRADKAKEVLQKYNFRRLILLGDIFDDLNFHRLKREHWGFLTYIRKLSNPKKQKEVIWVEGNHDAGLSKIMSHMMGLKVHKQYIFETAGQKILSIHGHQFDRFLNENLIISNIAGYIYNLIQRFGGKKQRFARFLKKASKGWLRLTEKIAIGALKYANRRKANIVICGHTHVATVVPIVANNIKYYNTGCFTDIPSNYIIITEMGEIINKDIE